MSFGDKVVLWLHIAVAVVTVGPVTLAISSTPRYIRRRDIAVLRYLSRITTIFTVASLAVLVLGIVLGQLLHEFSKPWLTAAMTLFLVAIVLLVMVIRDQRKAIRALEEAAAADRAGAEARSVPAEAAGEHDGPAALPTGPDSVADGQQAGRTAAVHLASVERGRIAAMGGIVNLIWLVVLALMVWQP